MAKFSIFIPLLSMIQNISFPNFLIQKQKPANQNSLERMPARDCVSFGSKNIPAEIKEVLDNTEFNIDDNKSTIRDYFKSCIINERPTKNLSLYHCTSTKAVANSILENGLDWTKTGRKKCGPGTYFSASVAENQGLGSVIIVGKYIGDKKTFPVFKPKFYESVEYNDEIVSKLSEITQNKNLSVDYINKYCHSLLLDDMGIDILYAASGRSAGAYVVFNDNCMQLSKYYW